MSARGVFALTAYILAIAADGTYLAFGPDKNLARLTGWLDELHHTPSLFGT